MNIIQGLNKRGLIIKLTSDEVALAIDSYLVVRDVHVSGPRTIRINCQLIDGCSIWVDPSGFVIDNNTGKRYHGKPIIWTAIGEDLDKAVEVIGIKRKATESDYDLRVRALMYMGLAYPHKETD